MATTERTSDRMDDEALAELRARLRGGVLLPDEEGYHEARSIWNGMIDRRPAVILRATGTSPRERSGATTHATG